ncbi:hypothetical protein SAMN05428964_1011858 [Thalassospira xiamenensis]|uniref:Uncharacterized protein n=1 Tax=Thalassospira xiamenensis TaxID=220697 RepID=A0A285RR90_9PROT|nr:hypothetical protein SAMN05428964_1011858 [Thalassospira xiamenensis]
MGSGSSLRGVVADWADGAFGHAERLASDGGVCVLPSMMLLPLSGGGMGFRRGPKPVKPGLVGTKPQKVGQPQDQTGDGDHQDDADEIGGEEGQDAAGQGGDGHVR